MSTHILLLNLVITIILILFLILKLKQNPIIGMFIGALYMGIFSKSGLINTINAIVTGFGNTMTGIGISVGFGIILGQIVADAGAVQAIANYIIKLFGEKKSDVAMGTTGFIVSIPVFYDVGYVILLPIAKILAKSTKKNVALFISSLVAGLGIAHTFVPPTPGPLTGAELLSIDVGKVILFGLIIGIPSFLITIFIYKNFFNEKCFDMNEIEKEKLEENKIEKLPSFFKAIFPIFLPILLIVIGTVSNVILKEVPEWVIFISNKNIAMFIGVLAAFLLAKDILTQEQLSKSIDNSLASAGIVLLITGMGGGLGNVLNLVGIGTVMLEVIQTLKIHPIIFIWLVSALLRMAQGSGTVAIITSISLIAPMVNNLNTPPVLLAMAAFSGSLLLSHVNDSGFWVTAKIAKLSTIGGLKTYTLICFLESIVSLIIILILNIIL